MANLKPATDGLISNTSPQSKLLRKIPAFPSKLFSARSMGRAGVRLKEVNSKSGSLSIGCVIASHPASIYRARVRTHSGVHTSMVIRRRRTDKRDRPAAVEFQPERCNQRSRRLRGEFGGRVRARIGSQAGFDPRRSAGDLGHVACSLIQHGSRQCFLGQKKKKAVRIHPLLRTACSRLSR